MGARALDGRLLVEGTTGGGSGGTVNIGDGVTNTILATVFDRANSNPVATQLVDSNGDPITTFGGSVSNTSTVTSVNSTTVNTTILASNASRLMASVFNDALGILYLKLGTTASTTSYTVQIGPGMYYELPYTYKGQIDGIWSTVSAGLGARIDELT